MGDRPNRARASAAIAAMRGEPELEAAAPPPATASAAAARPLPERGQRNRAPGPWEAVHGILKAFKARIEVLESANAEASAAPSAHELPATASAAPARAVSAYIDGDKNFIVRMDDGSEVPIHPVNDENFELRVLPAELWVPDPACLDEIVAIARRSRH